MGHACSWPHVVMPRSFSRGSLHRCCGQAPRCSHRWINHSSQTGVCSHDLSPLDVSDTEAPHLHCGRTDLQECQEPDRAGQPVCCCQWREWRWKGRRASFPPCQLHDWLDGQTGWAGAPGSVTREVSVQRWVGPGQEVRSQGF